MKQFSTVLLAIIILLLATACGDRTVSDNSSNTPDSSQNAGNTVDSARNEEERESKETKEVDSLENDSGSIVDITERQASLDALDEVVSKDVEDTISNLCLAYENLTSNVDTYDKYIENAREVEELYEKIYEDTKQLCNRMYSYSLNYAELILESDQSYPDKYDDLDIIYDNIYDDIGDDIYDEIYDGILDDMYDYFYDGILDDAYDYVEYREWSDALSDEYDWWSDTRTDVYRKWSDFHSDVYSFWSDIRSAVYRGDLEKAEEEIAEFREDMEKIIKKDK